MSVQASASRPTGRSVGAATLGLVVTLALFLAAMLAFVVAPLALFAVALLAYLALRPRSERTPTTVPGPVASASRHGFGAGTR